MRGLPIVALLLVATLMPSALAQVDFRCRSSHATPADGALVWVGTLGVWYGQDWEGPMTVEVGLDWASSELDDPMPITLVLQQPEGNQSAWDDARWPFAFQVHQADVDAGPQRAMVRLWRVDGSRQMLSQQQVEITLGGGLARQEYAPRLCHHHEADLEGDGVVDLRFVDAATGEPSPQEFAVDWRMVHGFYAGRYLGLTVSLTDRDHPVMLRIPEATALRLLDANPSDVEASAGRSTKYAGIEAGNHTWIIGPWTEVEASYSVNTYLDAALFDRRRAPLPPDLEQAGWRDGTDLHLNLTRWDLDGDNRDDLGFWASTVVDRDAARLQSAPERRTGSVPMVAHAVVNDTAHSRRLTMEFSRFDGSHEGAWIEIRGADDLFRRLLADSTVDGNATPVYDVDLGPDAGFVEKDDNGTLWVWLQHFSTREFTVVMPLRDSTGSASAEGSGPAVTLIAAALAIAAFSRRRPG